MKKIVLPLIGIALIATACDTSRSVSNNYYEDGIYHNPKTDPSESFSLNDLKEKESVTTNPDATGDVDYYDPDDNNYNPNYSSGATGTTVVNNYYGPSYRYPGYNSGFYWNSWGGWGMSIGYGWGYPYCYDPFFYDPWYSPYYGYYYNPYAWRGAGFYGYNSYWAGYYNGFYHGYYGSDYYGPSRNVVYVKNGNNSYRSNSYNNVLDRKSTNVRKSSNSGNQRTSVVSRQQDNRPANISRNTTRVRNENVVASSRFNDKNISASRISERSDNTISRTSLTNTRDGYNSNSYEYVRSRATTERSNRTPVATENTLRSREFEENRRATDIRSNTRSYPKTESRPTSSPQRINRSGRNTDDLYVPSRDRNERYKTQPSRTIPQQTPSRNDNNIRQRNESPSRINRSSSPSRSNNSYTPSPSNSRSYTPSNSGRSYTPSSGSSSRSYNSGRSGSSRGR